MTYQIFQLPKQTLISGAAIKPSWKVNFYLTGTTTPAAVYTTSALAVAHTQPVQADGGGVLATVYLDPAVTYKASVYDQNDVLQYTVDPVNDAVLSQAAIGAALYPRTAVEISAGVTPSSYVYPPGDEARWGPDSAGSSDSATALTNADSTFWLNSFSVSGTYSIAPISLTSSIAGKGWTSTAATPPDVKLVKRSNGTQLTMSGDDTFISKIDLDGDTGGGKTGDGLQLAATRQLLDCVSSHSQGSDGIRLGGAGATGVFNANLWLALRPVAISNGSDGCYIHHSGGTVTGSYPNGTPDVNAGLMLGADFRSNSATGMTIQNSIDNVFVGVTAQNNTGKGIVLKSDAKGHKFFGLYSEANNGATGVRGDEVDIESGATENLVIGLRSNQTAGAGIRDVNTAGKNLLMHYDAGVGSWVYRAKFALWNPFEDGSTTTDFECWCGTTPVNAYNLKGSVGGTTGGVFVLQTKADGGSLTDRLQVAQNGDVTFKNQTNGTLFGGKTAFDTTTTGTTIEHGAGRIDIVNSGAGSKTVAAFYDASGAAGSISTNGSGTTAYNTSSDARLKEAITPSGEAGGILDAIKVRSFVWKKSGKAQPFGVIAQEIAEVVPECVSPLGTGDLLGVDYSKLVPLLVKEIQSLRERVSRLESA